MAPHPEGAEAMTRVGFVAGKRVGIAVVRNRARRRARESVRLRYERLPKGRDLVLILRTGSAHASFDALDSAIERLLAKAGLLEESAAKCVPSPSG
jgi:ribonuclease P protein component